MRIRFFFSPPLTLLSSQPFLSNFSGDSRMRENIFVQGSIQLKEVHRGCQVQLFYELYNTFGAKLLSQYLERTKCHKASFCCKSCASLMGTQCHSLLALNAGSMYSGYRDRLSPPKFILTHTKDVKHAERFQVSLCSEFPHLTVLNLTFLNYLDFDL